MEAGFYGKNAQSAYKLGYARSAACSLAALRKVEVVEYSPRKIKQAVTGNGNASKTQVKYMVKTLLRLDDGKKIREDEADACAVAICHVQNQGQGERGYRSWKEFVANNKQLLVRGIEREQDRMIYKITGRLAVKNPTMLVVEVNGLSYEVNVPLSTYERVGTEGSEVALFTILVVREDDLQLYGFSSEDERKLFKLLISVSGIGPRTALSLLSSADVGDIFGFIANSNLEALMSIPGIGKKTAERVVLELRDKVLKLDVGVAHEALEGKEEIRAEAVDAMLALGYSRMQSERAIREALKNGLSSAGSVEELVRAALKQVK